jgi:hypothetical protein
MTVKAVTQTSGSNAAQTITITMPTTGKKGRRMFIRHLTVTTHTADIAGDVDIVINDNAVAVWAAALRSGKVYGASWDFGKGIPIRDGNCTIVIDALGAAGTTIGSVIYELI